MIMTKDEAKAIQTSRGGWVIGPRLLDDPDHRVDHIHIPNSRALIDFLAPTYGDAAASRIALDTRFSRPGGLVLDKAEADAIAAA